jgi:DegV family protein with EDD domain
MALVRIVTDGGADLPSELADSLGIGVVRGGIHFGEEGWQGSVEEFWRRVRAGGPPPSTSAPTVEALAEAFAGPEPVCALHVSAELSRTTENAMLAGARSGERVHVVDSRSLSVGTGLVAMVAGQAAAADVDFDGIRTLVGRLVERVHVHALIGAVDYLVRGGRAGLLDTHAVKHGASQILAVKGHAIPLRQVKGRRRAIDELLSHVAEHAEHDIGPWAVGHGDAADVDDFVSGASRVLKSEPVFVVSLGPSVGAHAGPDALVLGFLS